MPLHCAATRPKFLNVPSFSSKSRDLLTKGYLRIEHMYVTIFNDFFVFFRLLSLALWCRLVKVFFYIIFTFRVQRSPFCQYLLSCMTVQALSRI